MRFQVSHSHLLFLLVLSSFPSTASASVGPIFSFPSCSICPVEGDSPMNGDLILPVNTAGILIDEATCAQVQENAQDGDYSPFACIVLQQQVAEECGCSTGTPVMAPPTDTPVTAPTGTPVVAPVVTGTPTVAPATGVPTMAPVSVTTPVPVAVTPVPVTGTPTMVPLVESEAPATMQPAPLLNTTVGVTFDGVTDLSTEMEAALIASCEQYLAEQLPCATNLTCAIAPAPTRQRQLLRSLQTTSPRYVFIISGITDDLTEEEFTAEVVAALNNPDFVNTLNQTPGFESVTTVFATPADGSVTPSPVPPTEAPVVAVVPTEAPVVAVAPTEAPVVAGSPTEAPVVAGSPTEAPIVVVPPTEAPVVAPVSDPVPVAAPVPDPAPAPAAEDDDDGLGGGAIAGIVIGVAVGVALIGCGIYYASKGSSSNATDREVLTTTAASGPPRSIEPISEVTKSDMMNPPPAFQATKIDKPPVAAAAAVAAAASGIFQGDPSIIKTGSQIGAEGTDATTDASTVAGDTAASGAMSSLKQSMLCREVEAPPGKLGIVIDTTLEGPVVHKISADSPLEGVIFPGDIIVAINDVDTRAMSASAITALMARTSTSRRVLTVLSEDVSN